MNSETLNVSTSGVKGCIPEIEILSKNISDRYQNTGIDYKHLRSAVKEYFDNATDILSKGEGYHYTKALECYRKVINLAKDYQGTSNVSVRKHFLELTKKYKGIGLKAFKRRFDISIDTLDEFKRIDEEINNELKKINEP